MHIHLGMIQHHICEKEKVWMHQMGKSENINRRTDNTMTKGKRTNTNDLQINVRENRRSNVEKLATSGTQNTTVWGTSISLKTGSELSAQQRLIGISESEVFILDYLTA